MKTWSMIIGTLFAPANPFLTYFGSPFSRMRQGESLVCLHGGACNTTPFLYMVPAALGFVPKRKLAAPPAGVELWGWRVNTYFTYSSLAIDRRLPPSIFEKSIFFVYTMADRLGLAVRAQGGDRLLLLHCNTFPVTRNKAAGARPPRRAFLRARTSDP
jgi:hypothetical protein